MAEEKTEFALSSVVEEAPALADIGALPQEQAPATFVTRQGTITYIVQGSLTTASKQADGKPVVKPAIVTYHDVGLDYRACFQSFFTFPAAEKLLDSFCIIHVHAPGQEPNAAPLPEGFQFPTLDGLANQVFDLLESLGVKMWIGVGAGAGGNVLLRCSLNKERRRGLTGLMLVGTNFRSVGWWEYLMYKMDLMRLPYAQTVPPSLQDKLLDHYFSDKTVTNNIDMVEAMRKHLTANVNPRNLSLFLNTCLSRDDLYAAVEAAPPHCDILLVGGHHSLHLNEIEQLNGLLPGAKSSYLKIYDCGNLVTEERPGSVLRAFVLFLQGLGFGASIVVQLHHLSNQEDMQRSS
ncbi:hypothetical protein PTSG_00420 [Salpingoeca rosetta]|uniref:N-myc downstream regulated n=1 Tax=Salpingoeca rosetta (strain ATCC 50818 / BSB-021) TaxID=946362 RepID=F2TWF4_SALR5|nr:uncharacterized protein PTSG_00420 [Salpingoeca rosetta]EGD72400.1 hypothetical protein PTSG_00420 [Salpingoeca rosetta]|eukprot:XP_004998969.1 hypothetical protein PTSG_00420 [Salpingoeca rosetta]